MSDRWGSHWRLRVAMVCIAVALVCYGAWQGWRWKYRAVVESGGSPVVFRVVHHDWSQSIEALDWKTGKRWRIGGSEREASSGEVLASIQAARDGQVVLWRQGARLYMANVRPPYDLRSCKIPFGSAEIKLLGISEDGRFALFRGLRVADLMSGKVVSAGEWRSQMAAIGKEGESQLRFEEWGSIGSPESAPKYPRRGPWKLSARDEWELSSDGAGYGWGGDWLPMPGSYSASVLPVARTAVTGELLLYEGHVGVISDVRDDIMVFDPWSGNVITKDASGSKRRIHIFVASVVLLVCSAVWMWIAIAEADVRWGMFDALAATLLIPAALLLVESSIEILYRQEPHSLDFPRMVASFLLRGGLIGVATLVGWYWAHGRERLALRWLLGMLWLFAYAAPLAMYAQDGHNIHPFLAIRGFVVVALFLSAAVTGVTLIFGPLGWGIRPPAESPTVWHFGIFEVMVLMASVGAAILIVETFSETVGGMTLLRRQDWPLAAPLVGVALVGLLFVRSRRALVGGVMLIGVALVAATLYVRDHGKALGVVPFDRCVVESAALVGSVVVIVLPCLVLRWRGWGWTQLQEAGASKEAVA